MVPFSDFPSMVAGVEKDVGLTWDFKLPTGVTLTGPPTVNCEVYEHSSDSDTDPQSRVNGTSVGTYTVTSCAVIASFGPTPADKTVTYLFIVSCDRSDGGVAACFNHITAVKPS